MIGMRNKKNTIAEACRATLMIEGVHEGRWTKEMRAESAAAGFPLMIVEVMMGIKQVRKERRKGCREEFRF